LFADTSVVFFGDPYRFILNAIYLVPALVIGLVAHELAHAAVAVARGDQTPRLDGRLSLDPSHHLDPLGTIAVFFVHFGWAKPIRLNPYRMRSALDPALVALAGPFANLLIALLLSLPIKLALAGGFLDPASPPWALLLVAFYLNVLLAIINLLPLPMLDGYNLLGALFRRRFSKFFFRIDSYRQVILLVAVVVLLFIPGLLDVAYDPVAGFLLGAPIRPSGF
jgi:Zn-dependent protease